MRVRFVAGRLNPTGGLTLATTRLARTLSEAGHAAEVVYAAGEPPTADGPRIRREDDLPDDGESVVAGDAVTVRRMLSRGDPDLLVVADPDPGLLRAASEVAPSILHSHVHDAVCPDGTRFWHRLRQPCRVVGGWKCLALRPVLGCSGRRRVLRPDPVREHQQRMGLLRSGRVGVVAISNEQRRLLREAGVPDRFVTVVPNLGIRRSAGDLAEAADRTPPTDRNTVAFIGRLDKAKGAEVLPEVASRLAEEDVRLRVFGDGYLRGSLAADLEPGVLGGRIDQRRVSGVLLWTRGVAFTSLWPEPGGIVGLDAQLFGAPLAAFRVGAALDWPAAELFAPGDGEQMAGWLADRPPVDTARRANVAADRQARYWQEVGRAAAATFTDFVATGTFDGGSESTVSDVLSLAMDPAGRSAGEAGT